MLKVKKDELKIAFAIFLTLFNLSPAASGLTQVINKLCAKYDYKMDIAVKQEEAFEDGKQQKAIEDAKNALAMNLTPEQVAKITGLTVEQIADIADND